MNPGNAGGAKGRRKVNVQGPNERTHSRRQVPLMANPAGQPLTGTDRANRLVWADHMLDALPMGVRGGSHPITSPTVGYIA